MKKFNNSFFEIIGIFFLILLYIIVPFSNLKYKLQELRKNKKIVKKFTKKEYDDFKFKIHREREVAAAEGKSEVKNELLEYVNAKIKQLDHNAVCFLLCNYEKFRKLETSGNSWSENGWNFYVGTGNHIYVEEPCYLEFEGGNPVYYERKEIISYEKYKQELLNEAKYLNKATMLLELFKMLEVITLALNSADDYTVTGEEELCYRRKLYD